MGEEEGRGGVLTAFISINKRAFYREALLRALSGGRRESYTLTTSARVHLAKQAHGESPQRVRSLRNSS